MIFGETHGSQEIPKHMYNVICNALKSNKKVLFGLEFLAEFDAGYKEIAAMTDKKQRTDKVLTELLWGVEEGQDAKTSLAMFKLLDAVFDLISENKKLDIFVFDANVDQLIGDMTKRDFLMAENVLNIAKDNDDSLIIILTGSFHNQTERIIIGDMSSEQMTKFIKKGHEDVHSITFRYETSNSLSCHRRDCGVKTKKSNSETIDKSVEFSQSDAPNQHKWDWYIGTLSASLRAVSELSQD